jgi:hypothetical protein
MDFFSFLKYTFIIFAAHLATSCGPPFENHWSSCSVVTVCNERQQIKQICSPQGKTKYTIRNVYFIVMRNPTICNYQFQFRNICSNMAAVQLENGMLFVLNMNKISSAVRKLIVRGNSFRTAFRQTPSSKFPARMVQIYSSNFRETVIGVAIHRVTSLQASRSRCAVCPSLCLQFDVVSSALFQADYL